MRDPAASREPVDDHVVRAAGGLVPTSDVLLAPHERAELLRYLDAQLLSRHTDLAARELQAVGEAFYTIGSAGHEANAAVALALRPTDPALLHYRSGGFYAARASQVPGVSAAADILSGAMSSTSDPISGGRHKVFGSTRLGVLPQTSTIASHLPRAFGLAFALDNPTRDLDASPWPADAVVVCSFGDASANHSTALGSFNAAAYCVHRDLRLPLLLVCEDNGLGISTRTPDGWVENQLRRLPGIGYHRVSGERPQELLATTREVVASVRAQRRPAILHLETVRFMGHAGSDVELAYRSRREIERDHARDPLLATAQALVDAGELTGPEVVERYERTREEVRACAAAVSRTYLSTAAEVMAPIAYPDPSAGPSAGSVRPVHAASEAERRRVFGGRLPEDAGPLTLALSVNAALKDLMASRPRALVLGEDVGRKGGVYGVTRGLLRAFGPDRVVDTILDEQTVLGIALGSALAGALPIPEIQYLAYLHNAEDQLRGEAATLPFFSDGQLANPMVVRIAGLAYQKGFGGHFHNDNSVAVLRDVPGLVVAVPSHPSTAPGLLRECVRLAVEDGRVCVFLEPIALYHERDLAPGDGVWTASYAAPASWDAGAGSTALGRTATLRHGDDLLVLTFGNGVRMSLHAADALAGHGIESTVVDLQWLAPLPVEEIVTLARQHRRVLVVDETRRSGGVAESVVALLVDHEVQARIRRVTSHDSFIPLGPASSTVLLGVDDVVAAALDLARS